MQKENIIWSALIFGTILFIALAGVIISFVLLYQKKKYRHQQEVLQMQETFAHEMLHSKSEIQEQTLQHIATEIHDNFNPTLSVVNLNLASVIPSVNEPIKETIVDTKFLVKQLMAEMKSISASLNTDQISRIGFVRSLENYLQRLQKTGAFIINFSQIGDDYRLPPNKEIILFRMSQEIINNIVKHAVADKIDITLKYERDSFVVEIKDDGKGFDLMALSNDPLKQDSTGLRNLKSRADVISAILSIESTLGVGTSIEIKLLL